MDILAYIGAGVFLSMLGLIFLGVAVVLRRIAKRGKRNA